MNPAITVELRFFLISILWGVLLLLAYDVIRIIRRLIPHNSFFIAVQDFLFWVSASLFIFAMIYEVNDGILRGFCALGILLGAVVYHFSVSDLLINIVTKLIRMMIKLMVLVFKPVKLILVKLGRLLHMLFSRISKVVNNPLFRLKNNVKSVKISLLKRKH